MLCVCWNSANSLESLRFVCSGGTGRRCVRSSTCDWRRWWGTQTTISAWTWSRRASSTSRYRISTGEGTGGGLANRSSCETQVRRKKTNEMCVICVLWMSQFQFIDTVVERQPKLRRQRCIFTKERGRGNQLCSHGRFLSTFASASLFSFLF